MKTTERGGRVHRLDESGEVLRRVMPRLSLRDGDAGGRWELNCEVVEFSFSHFQEDTCYVHPTPPVSRLFMIEEGRAVVDAAGERRTLEAGGFHLLPANRAFQVEYAAGTVIKGFHLHLFDGVRFPVAADLPGIVSGCHEEYFRALRRAVSGGDPAEIRAMLLPVVAMLTRRCRDQWRRRQQLPQVYREMLVTLGGAHPAALRLEHLARRYRTSPEALSKGFRRQVGIPFKHYLLNAVMERARDLLLHSELTATEVALELGYAEPEYFFRIFKARFGMTPGNYRRMS